MHRHIFKVGWLLTHNYQITTILYYIVFLPGVLLHEVTYWLAAGVLNVRASRSIQLPQKQEIGKLELNFIKLTPKAHPLKRAVIAGAPLVAGLLAIWVIAVNAFALETVLGIAAPGQLDDVALAASTLAAQADFWLWFYLAFTISNTMFPTIPAELRGWRQIGAAALPVMVIVLVLGISQTFAAETGTQLLNGLALILGLTTLINVFMVIVLGTVETIIERLTGHSAAFQDGKMITMTRQQALQQKAAEKQQRQPATSAPAHKATAAATSIYMLKLPIPGPPGQEPVSKNVVTVLDAPGAKQEPAVGDKDKLVSSTADKPARPTTAARLPSATPPAIPTRIDSQALGQKEKPAFDIAPFSNVETDSGQKQSRQPGAKSGEKPAPKRQRRTRLADHSGKETEPFAQFSRPFVKPATANAAADDRDAADDSPPASTDAPFMRPFATTDSLADENIDKDNAPPAKPMSNSPPKLKSKTSHITASSKKHSKSKSMPVVRKTRPAPKPSSQPDKNANPDDSPGYSEDQELKYEPIDDEYDEDDDRFYDDV